MKRKMFGHAKTNARSGSQHFHRPRRGCRPRFQSRVGSGVGVDDRTSISPWPFDRLSLYFPATEASRIVARAPCLAKMR